MATANDITIYDAEGNARCAVLPNKGSKRVRKLMGDDYALLKFTLAAPVSFAVGDSCDVPMWDNPGYAERMLVCKLQAPTYNKATGGYDYELTVEPPYRLWRNKLFKFTPGSGAREASWTLTAELAVHLGVFLRNLAALGCKYNGTTDYAYSIDSTVEASAKCITYDGTDLLSALDSMAEAWECEWWVDGPTIRFGRCEAATADADATSLETGVSAESIEATDNRDTYATRIYAFGSTRNIPVGYRRTLTFTSPVAGSDISDPSRPLSVDMFPEGDRTAAAADVTAIPSTRTSTVVASTASAAEFRADSSTVRVLAGDYTLDPSQLTATVRADFDTGSAVRPASEVRHSLYMLVAYTDGTSETMLIEEGSTYLPAYGVERTVMLHDKAVTLAKDADVTARLVLTPLFTQSLPAKFSYKAVGDYRLTRPNDNASATLTVKFLSGNLAGTTATALLNPDHKEAERSLVRLQGGLTADPGSQYTVANIVSGKVPAHYYQADATNALTVDGIAERRLMLPDGTPCIDARSGMAEDEVVEAVAVFDDIYPRTDCTVTEVSTYEKTTEDEDGNKVKSTFWRFKTSLTFRDSYRIDGEDLVAVFTSGKLNGMEFVLQFNPLGLPETDADAQLWEIIANEDYGRMLPDSILCPSVGDKFVLAGWDSDSIAGLGLVAAAEQELLAKAREYMEKSKIDPRTYTVRLMSDYAYGLDAGGNPDPTEAVRFALGDKVTLVGDEFFADGSRVSRVIGYEVCLDLPYDTPEYTIGETAARSRLSDVERKVEVLTMQGQTYTGGGNGGASVYLITTKDSTAPADNNAYSALRSRKEFLSRTTDDKAAGRITFKEGLDSDKMSTFVEGLVARALSKFTAGIQLGADFASGLTGYGGRIDGGGVGELDALTLRRWLEVPELRYNRVAINVGNSWRAPGGGIVESVNPSTGLDSSGNPLLTGVLRLKLEDGEYGTLAVDDICMGVFHDGITTANNATADADDQKGNFHFAGFATCYFRVTAVSGVYNETIEYALRPPNDTANGGDWHTAIHPYEAMNIVAYGNFTNADRQCSRYSTRTYERYLQKVNWWEFSAANIGAQFGDLSGLSVFGLNMSGYSAYLDNLYMTGKINMFNIARWEVLIDMDGDSGIFLGETKTVTATLVRMNYSVAKELGSSFSSITWKVERDSGNAAADALWNANTTAGAGKLVWPVSETADDGSTVLRYDKATIDITWSASAALDDMNASAATRTLFTFTATVPDGSTTSATVTI